jgi:hypothetical protein
MNDSQEANLQVPKMARLALVSDDEEDEGSQGEEPVVEDLLADLPDTTEVSPAPKYDANDLTIIPGNRPSSVEIGVVCPLRSSALRTSSKECLPQS